MELVKIKNVDVELEQKIENALRTFEDKADLESWREFIRLIKQRSPTQIAKMESEKFGGTRGDSAGLGGA